jgi:hypothetical protein
MTCIIVMDTGDSYSLRGYASEVQARVNEARGSEQLIPLERDRIPTGQMIYLDPDHVMAVKDE